MDLEIIILSEVSQTEKDKHLMILLIYGIFKKNDTNERIYKTETDSQMVTKGERGGGINWELGINRYTLLHIK